MEYDAFFEFFQTMLQSFASIGQWLIKPLGIGLPSPLLLLTFGGLAVILGIYIVRLIIK